MILRKDEATELRMDAARARDEKERARLDLQASLQRLAKWLEEIPIDQGIDAIGSDLGGNADDKR